MVNLHYCNWRQPLSHKVSNSHMRSIYSLFSVIIVSPHVVAADTSDIALYFTRQVYGC